MSIGKMAEHALSLSVCLMCGCLAACSMSTRIGDTPALRATLDANELNEFSKVLNDVGGQRYVLHSFASGQRSEQAFEGAIFLPSTRGLSTVETGTYDDRRGSIIRPLDLNEPAKGALSLRTKGRQTLALDYNGDGLVDVAQRIDRFGDSDWLLVAEDLEGLNECVRSRSSLEAFTDLDSCGAGGDDTPQLTTPSGGSGTDAARFDASLFGDNNCSRDGGYGPNPVVADGNGSSDSAEQQWRDRERALRNRSRYHTERAASLGKDGGNEAEVALHEEAATRATEAANAAEAQIPREPGTAEYEAGDQAYDSARVRSDTTTQRTFRRRALVNDRFEQTFPSDRDPSGEQPGTDSDQSGGDGGGAEGGEGSGEGNSGEVPDNPSEPLPDAQASDRDPRCLVGPEQLVCEENPLDCIGRSGPQADSDLLSDATRGRCRLNPLGPDGGQEIVCAAVEPPGDEEPGDEDDPRELGNTPPAGGNSGVSFVDLLPLGDVVLAVCQAGPCPWNPEQF